MNVDTDYYEILGVLANAEDVVIRATYKALAQKYHPDRDKGDAYTANIKMATINEAYSVLSDPKKRAEYDLLRHLKANIGQQDNADTRCNRSQHDADSPESEQKSNSGISYVHNDSIRPESEFVRENKTRREQPNNSTPGKRNTSTYVFAPLLLLVIIGLLTNLDGINHREEPIRVLADRGDATAQFKMGELFFSQWGEWAKNSQLGFTQESRESNSDLQNALSWYKKSAHQGNAASQYKMGFFYEYGAGVPANLEEARYWYLKAAMLGNLQAKLDYAKLSLLYFKDYKEALTWYQKAAESGNASAMLDLALIYEKGEGASPNVVQAYMWASLAEKYGDKSPKALLQRLDDNISNKQLDEALVLKKEWIKKHGKTWF